MGGDAAQALSAGALGAAIRDAVTRDSYRDQAREVARRLATEDGAQPVIKALELLDR